MEIALNSDTQGGFTHGNAIASQNGLALLASLTLKNALNINNNNNNKNNTSKTNNNINKHMHKNNNNNLNLNLNHINGNSNSNINNNKHKIRHHKSPQSQHSFISSSTNETSLTATISFSSTSSNTNLHEQQQIPDHNNVFTFTSAGLQAMAASSSNTLSSKQQSSSTAANNNQTISTKSTSHHQASSATSSAKDSTEALLKALYMKTNKKQQQSVSIQQQQPPQTSIANVSATTSSVVVGNGGINNNSSGSGGNGNGNGNSNRNNFKIPSDILDDLASRFIINVPDMELNNLIRICFQIELAHWFYLDFFCSSDDERKLQSCGIKQFALQLFEHIPFLRQHLSSIDKILEDWKNYKLSVPTYGAILISEDLNYCLLVQSYFAKSSWGFPKGKVNENEDPVHCATREVYEETGYDITELIVPNDYIEAVINYQYTRLYIVRDVSLETKFSPRTRNEIKCCDWFPIDSLPVNKSDAISKPKLGINANSFFMIMPFVKRLKKWVNDKRNGVDTRRKYSGGGGSPTSTSPIINGQMKSNCKKQQKRITSNNFNNTDDTNALNNGGASVGNVAGAAALTAISCGNNATLNSNRSKRQRHKSMGDLDGIKLNNFNNSNNQSNCKTNNNNNNNCGSISTITANSGGNNTNSNNNNNQKRHSKIVAVGSNVSSNNNASNGCNNNITNCNNSSSKRQMYHSQSQTSNIQQNGEKIVSSFDLIRKEKQQMKAALSKTQKQQQQNSNCNSSNSGRQRAKSQSDKISMQQQQQQQQQKANGNGNNNNKQQQRIQKQQSLIVTNSNMQSYNNSNNSNHQNNSNNNSNGNKSCNNNNQTNNNQNILSLNNNFINMTIGRYKTPTPPPINGKDLLALAAAAAAAKSVVNDTSTTKKCFATANTSQFYNMPGNSFINNNNGQQKPRPSSVSLHFSEGVSIKKESSDMLAFNNNNQMPQLQRMASGTNLRILKRSTSHQPTQQNHSNPQQPPQRQASALQFTPNFNSWTNFTFTKNFIANVFC